MYSETASVTADIKSQPHFTKEKDNGSAALADKRQSDSGIGNGIGDNGNVQDNLDCQMAHDSGRQK